MSRYALILTLLAVMQATGGYAQQTFRGTVTGSDGLPLEAASVQLLRGSDEWMTAYTLTDAKGVFSLATRQAADSLLIAVSALGYKTFKAPAHAGEVLHIVMEQQAFSLKEVEIRPGRIWGRQDTINYDVAHFLSPKDESIKDVIRKLPGMDVDDAGRISYNGKSISHLYVEGMNLIDGRYNRITDNLQAKAVETVQVMENHQPIRILQDKIKTEDIALNLKLRPEFHDKWMVILQGGLSLSPLLREASVNAMQLSRQSQSAYLYKGNNAGNDVSEEQSVLSLNDTGALPEPAVPAFLSQPSLMAPLKKRRLLFNDVHSLSANRLYKLGETGRLRINAGYTHDIRRQERGGETDYYQPADTVRVAEQSHTRIRSDKAELSLNFENNAADHFLTNHFQASANRDNSLSLYDGQRSFAQEIKTPGAEVRNDFKHIRSVGDYTLEVRSLLRYNHFNYELRIRNYDDARQGLTLNRLYADHSFSVYRKKGAITHHYTVGTTGEATSVRDGFSLYAIPSWQWSREKWNARLSFPLVRTSYPGGGFGRTAANPRLYLHYKLNYAWRFSLSGSYRESYGDVTDFQAEPYRTDYRTTVLNGGFLSVRQQQDYSAYAEYKRTVQEFFATLSLTYTRQQANRLYEQAFDDGGQALLISHPLANTATSRNIRGTVSKGFYDWGLKTSLNYILGESRGERLSGGERIAVRSTVMQYEPDISWTPFRRFEAGYRTTLRYGSSTVGKAALAPLWNVTQRLQLFYELSGVALSLLAEHYRNDVGKGQPVHAFFADLSLSWRWRRWQFGLSATNLFDRRQYRYTEYSSIQSYTSWIHIRGRECLFSARYSFR
ncbi:MAG: TonB-dependent receptor [Tannerellaceae bacterium]|jgi:hypothetical protein|nr:TonB-dependent receptor [Tannerellaceae bacterium]